MEREEHRQEALRRIRLEAEEKTGKLDLSRLWALDELPPELSDLNHLIELDCSATEVADLSPLASLSSLQSLDCSNTKVAGLYPLTSLFALQSLYCWSTEISDLSALTSVAGLQLLHCSNTRIADLSPLAFIAGLHSLGCSSTQVADLSPLASIAGLQSLRCVSTQVSDLSPLASLAGLQSLDCSYTKVADLSPLTSIAGLRSLSCVRTRVADLSPLASIAGLQSLSCVLTRVANLSPLASIAGLQSLDCSFTKVADLSPLASLTKLEELRCKQTQIDDITPIADLSEIGTLELSDTRVSDLTSLVRLPKLVALFCNNLHHPIIPTELVFSGRLERLTLEGSNIEGIPTEITAGFNCLEALRSHFRDMEAGAEPLPDVKVIVLGNGRIGKTQLCGQLKGEPYEKEADSTHGILVSSAELGADRLHLWDFGGQDLYHGTHALFMRTRAVFVVLWTPGSENQKEHEWQGMTFRNHRLDYWLELVASLGGEHSPLLVVQCRCDTAEDELVMPPVETGLLQRFPFRKLLHHSSSTPRGLEAVHLALTEAIRWMRSKQGNVRIGAGRLRVKRRLEALRDADAALPVAERQHRLVSQAFYRAICDEEGGVSDADQLLSYLHECGVVFHRPGLFGDQIILDQGWALEAIYTVFNREKCWRQIRSLNGRFTRALLEALVWQRHSAEEQKLFLSMMESCGICFVHRELEDGEKEYIAPDLLPPDAELAEVLELRWGEGGPDQAWTYEIPHEHPGLMTAVISSVGAMAGIDAMYWRGGFCGYEKNTRSRVRVRDVSRGRELRIELETKGGESHSLFLAITKSLERTFYHANCREWEFSDARGGVRVMRNLNVGRLELQEEAFGLSELEFTEPPSTTTTYAVSYAWTDESSALVDKLCADADERGLNVLRDCNAVGLGEELTRFMKHLAAQDRVFVILSRKYLESPYCMFELLEIWRQAKQEKEAFLSRVRCFVMDDLQIRTVVQRAEWSAHWLKEIARLDELVKTYGAKVLGETGARDYMQMQQFSLHVTDILAHVNDILRPRNITELEEYGFQEE